MLPNLRKRRAAGGGRAVSGSASVRPPASTYYSYSTSPRSPGMGCPTRHNMRRVPCCSFFFASARFRGMFLARPATRESTTDVASRLSRAQPPKAVQQLHSIRLGLTVVTERTERARAQSPPCPAPCRVKPDNIDGSWNPQETQEITEGKNTVNVLLSGSTTLLGRPSPGLCSSEP